MTAERIKLVPKSSWARQFLRDRLEGCPWVYINDRRLQWYVCNYDLGVKFYIHLTVQILIGRYIEGDVILMELKMLFNLFQTGSIWSVLLERDNGYNKEVLIEDCMSEEEALNRAEDQYGLNAIRGLWMS